MIPAFNDCGGHNCRFLGFPMLQNRYSVPAWSYLIEDIKPQLIVEIGCWNGGLSCALGVAMKNYGGRVFCCDIADFSEDLNDLRRLLPIHFEKLDALSAHGLHLIGGLIERGGLTVVLCDGGNKPEEYNLYAPFLKQGDIIAAHDFQHHPHWPFSEINEAQVANACAKYSLEPFMNEDMHKAGWLVRRKVKA